MDDIVACRVCLIMDIKMYSLINSPLDNIFLCLFGSTSHNHKLLKYMCVECAALVNKFYLLREKYLRAQTVLQHIWSNKLTKKHIQSIDREHCKLTSTIGPSLPTNSYLFDCCSYSEEGPPQPENIAFIKEEIVDNDYGGDSYSDDNDMLTLKQIKIEMEETKAAQENSKENQHIIIVETENLITNKENTKEDLTCEKKQKPRNMKTRYSKSGPNTTRTKVVQSLDKEISQHFEVITRTLEEQIAEIKARENTTSYQRSSLKCTLCFKGFIHQNTYQHHMKKHNPSSGAIECRVCGFRFRSHGTLHLHERMHTHRFVCKVCRQVFTTRDQAKRHRIWHTGVTFECKHCFEKFSHRSSYLSHLRIKHPSQHICNLCGYSFLSDTGLKQHKSSMHKDIAESATVSGPRCDTCAIQFLSQAAFDRHLANSSNHIVDSDFPKGCRECGERFESAALLKAHQRLQHPAARRREWRYAAPDTVRTDITWPKKCDYCAEMVSGARQNWFHHRKEHAGEQYVYTTNTIFICEICGHKFVNKGVLKYHMRDKHSSERPHACPQCGKAFGTPAKLRVHLQAHSDLRPFVCGLCRKPFKSSSALGRHQKIHTGLRPYSCKYCNKTFGTSSARNLHIRSVHYKIPPPVSKRKLLTRGLKGGE